MNLWLRMLWYLLTLGGRARLTLPAEDRIVGLDLVLVPPAAPLRPALRFGEAGETDREGFCSDLVWNLPALGTKASRIALAPVQARTLTFTLPEAPHP